MVLWSLHQTSPIGAWILWYRIDQQVGAILFWTVLVVAAIVLLYPPALPFVKLQFAGVWRRLGTDRTPLHDGLARLRHLETHDDRLKVGRLALQLGDLPLAMENLSRAFELDPKHMTGRYQFALMLIETGNLEQAAQVLEGIIAEDEKHAFGEVLFQLGRCRSRLRRDKEAVEVLQRHQELFPGGRQSGLLLAHALANTGDLPAARKALDIARRPVAAGHHLTKEEALARARAKVTFLRPGGNS